MAAPYLPISLNGVDYLVDPIKRQTLPAIREQADTSGLPSESSLNPRGLWRRSQESWHHGAGQNFLDSVEQPDPYRFRASKGIDPWTRGELHLLRETFRWWPSTNTNLQMAITGTPVFGSVLGILISSATIWLIDGDNLVAQSALPNPTANYLSNDQFSAEPAAAAGVTAVTNCSVARSTTVGGYTGSAAWRLSSTASGTMTATTTTGTGGIPVYPSTLVAGSAVVRAGASARTVRVNITFYTAAGAVISTTNGSTLTDVVGSWDATNSRPTVQATSPSNAAFASLGLEVQSTGGAAELHYFDFLTLGPYSGSGTIPTTPFALNLSIHVGDTPEALQSITTDGNYVWVAVGTSGIHRTTTTVIAANVPGPVGASHYTHLVKYVNGRLMAAGSPTAGPATQRNVLYEITSPISAPAFSVIWTHPSTNFVWRGIAAGRNCIYAWGDSASSLSAPYYPGGFSEVYRITIEPTTTALGVPVSASNLPDGEVLHSLVYYTGGVIMGTNKGVRAGVVDGQGNIDYGAFIPAPPVKCLEPQGRHCWYGWTNYDASSTGLGRLDLGVFTEPLVAAWASDLMAGDTTQSVQGEVIDVISFPGSIYSEERRIFCVSGKGVFAEKVDVAQTSPVAPYISPANLAATGSLETGGIRYGTTVPKTLRQIEVRHHTMPTGASIAVEQKLDDASYSSVGSSTSGSGTTLATTGSAETAELRFTLNRATDTTDGAELVRYTLKSLPTPGRNEVFSLPIILKPELMDNNGQTQPVSVDAAFAALKALEAAGTVVTLTIGSDSYSVYVDQVQFEGEYLVTSEPGNYFYAGVATVLCQTADV